MNRKKKLYLNTLAGLLQKIVMIACGFIVPRYMLTAFGSSVNGLVSSIHHFLGFISLLELGIGPVITSNLYEPLAKKNKDQISRVIISSERFFRKIAIIFSIYVFILILVYPKFIKTDFEYLFTSSLLLIIAISTFANYFLGITYNLLLNADQKAYIPIALGILSVILNTICIVIGVKLGASIHIVMLFSTLAHLLKPIGQYLYVRKYYEIDKHLKLYEEPIKQKWNGFAQHLSAVVSGHIDVVALSCFSTLANVSIYHIYYLVTSGITNLSLTGTSGIESLFGNLLANKEKDKLIKFFSSVEYLFHNVVTLLFTTTAITIVPFVLVYTKGIKDADYNVPLFSYLLVFAYYTRCLRIPYFLMIRAAGRFKEIQNDSFISMGLNVVITLLVVKFYGLPGVALGTLVSMLYLTLYFVWYLKSNILKRKLTYFIRYFISDLLIIILSYKFSFIFLSVSVSNYIDWSVFALKIFITVLFMSLIINLIFFRSDIKNCYKLLHLKKNNNSKKD